MKTLGIHWFTGGTGTAGIVLVEGEAGDEDFRPGERGAYIGVAVSPRPDLDVQVILDCGAKLGLDHFMVLAKHFIRTEGGIQAGPRLKPG